MRQDIIDSLQRYVKNGIPTGSFLEAVIEGDLMEAFARADEQNIQDMFEIVNYVYNHVPVVCRGKRHIYVAMARWRKAGGMDGFMAMTEEERTEWLNA